MFKKIQLSAIVAISLTALTFSNLASATGLHTTAKVTNIFSAGPQTTDYDSFELIGVTTLGTCPTDGSTGLVIFAYSNDTTGTNPGFNRIFTIALAAYTLNKSLEVEVNDSTLLGGYCEVSWVQLQ